MNDLPVRKKAPRTEWTPDLSTGIEVLDDDHKFFFEVAASIKQATEEDCPSPQSIASILFHLNQYVDAHFRREEEFLANGPYQEFLDHKEEHTRFRNKLGAISTATHHIDPSELKGLGKLVVDWITAHIATTDMMYCSWLKDEYVNKIPLREFSLIRT